MPHPGPLILDFQNGGEKLPVFLWPELLCCSGAKWMKTRFLRLPGTCVVLESPWPADHGFSPAPHPMEPTGLCFFSLDPPG